MQLKLYNSLSRELETFEPLDKTGRNVSFYTCGPTVYDYAHIGNFRSFLNADVLRRTLETIGYQVKQVMNITDVGHMTEDLSADGGGQDKMEVASSRLEEAKKSGSLPKGIEIDPGKPLEVASFYADAFLEDAKMLGLKIVLDFESNPTLMPRPTAYIKEMISMVQKLIEKGNAYVASDGVVYFDINSFPAYGELSGNTLQALRSGEGGRVDMQTQEIKRNPADFMLWKPDKSHLMRWPSPWGEGYPGWHLECSAMALAILGEVIDIHSGGEDNIFPHHECEIAQTCCTTDSPSFANYWFHTRFLLVDGGKMSKSKGNFYTLRDLLEKGVSPAALRLELIKTHYRSNANFTIQGLKDSQRQVERWHRLANWLNMHQEVEISENGPLFQAKEKFMNSKMKEYFRLKLLNWKKELLKESSLTLNNLKKEENSVKPDLTDRASEEIERSLELRTRDRERKLINKIDSALKKIDDGSYGFCEETGEAIGIKRLEARPVATLSLEAQEMHEKKEKK